MKTADASRAFATLQSTRYAPDALACPAGKLRTGLLRNMAESNFDALSARVLDDADCNHQEKTSC